MSSKVASGPLSVHEEQPICHPCHLEMSEIMQQEKLPSQSCCMENSFRVSASVVSECSDAESIESQHINDVIPLDYRLDWSDEFDVDLTNTMFEHSIIYCDTPDDESSVQSVSADWDMESVFSIDQEEIEEEIRPSFPDCMKTYTWNTNTIIIRNDTT